MSPDLADATRRVAKEWERWCVLERTEYGDAAYLRWQAASEQLRALIREARRQWAG